jgi:hypothetical protein
MAEVKQSRANAREGELAVVAWKPHSKQYIDTLVMVSLEDLLDWIKKIREDMRNLHD